MFCSICIAGARGLSNNREGLLVEMPMAPDRFDQQRSDKWTNLNSRMPSTVSLAWLSQEKSIRGLHTLAVRHTLPCAIGILFSPIGTLSDNRAARPVGRSIISFLIQNHLSYRKFEMHLKARAYKWCPGWHAKMSACMSADQDVLACAWYISPVMQPLCQQREPRKEWSHAEDLSWLGALLRVFCMWVCCSGL